jgi:hypothetical protein
MDDKQIMDVWSCIWGVPRRPDWIDRVSTPTEETVFVEGVRWNDLPQPFFIHDIGGNTSELINPKDLVKALDEARLKGWGHCGGYVLNTENSDACFGDLILQQAAFGELVYG